MEKRPYSEVRSGIFRHKENIFFQRPFPEALPCPLDENGVPQTRINTEEIPDLDDEVELLHFSEWEIYGVDVYAVDQFNKKHAGPRVAPKGSVESLPRKRHLNAVR